MKKFFCALLCLLILLQMNIFVAAYSYEQEGLFSIDIPEGYEDLGNMEFLHENGSSFYISCEENEENFCVDNITEKKMLETAELMASESGDAFALLGKNGKTEVVSVEKTEHPCGHTAFVSVYKTSVTENGEVTTRYQKIYEFGGIKNKYNFVYTSADGDIDAQDEAFASIKIYEDEAPGVADKIGEYSMLALIVVLLGVGIFKFLKKPKCYGGR